MLSQVLLNEEGLYEQDIQQMSGFCINPINLPPNDFANLASCYQQLLFNKSLNNNLPSSSSSFALDHDTYSKPSSRDYYHDHLSLTSNMPQLVSPQRSTQDPWAWGEGINKKSNGEDRVGVSKMKMKKIKGRRKVREPRFCFKTMSDVDVLDDGYKWRKYGQKVVKNTLHPRSYYRCTQDNCRVKKRVERLAEDPRMVITTYEGRHAHSPSHDLDENESKSQQSSLLTQFFFS